MPFLLYPLALAVFALGTSEFMFSGLLPAVAADLGVAPGRAGLLTSAYAARGLAVILSGTTLALIAGAPLGAVLGDLFGWRAALWAVASIALLALVGVARTAPRRPGSAGAPGLGQELRSLARGPVPGWAALVVGLNAATFCAYTFLAPATTAAGLRPGAVAAVLAAFGVGAFGGVVVAGRVADRHWRPTLVLTVALLGPGWWLLAGADGWLVLPLAALQGLLSFAAGSTLIARLIAAAPGAPTMGGSFATAALNVGAVTGPAAGGWALGAAGATGPLLVAAGVAVGTGLLGVWLWLRTRTGDA